MEEKIKAIADSDPCHLHGVIVRHDAVCDGMRPSRRDAMRFGSRVSLPPVPEGLTSCRGLSTGSSIASAATRV
jgi:hypothetical protein